MDQPRQMPVVEKQAERLPATSPGRKGDLHRQATDRLRRMILSGELRPGERLREVEIGERLGMSRTPVRETFRTLAAEGLVHVLPNRSVWVSELDKAEAAEVFAVLGVLEAFAGRLACQRITAVQIDRLAELQDDLERHYFAGERRSYLETNRMIHAHLVEASGNKSLIRAWRLLVPQAERARQVSTLDHQRWGEAFQEHREIFDAIVGRNAARLQQLMEAHFVNGIESMKKTEEDLRGLRTLA